MQERFSCTSFSTIRLTDRLISDQLKQINYAYVRNKFGKCMYISDVYISHHSHTTTPMYRETIGVLSENYASCVAHKHHMMRFIDHLNQIMRKFLKHYTQYMAILPSLWMLQNQRNFIRYPSQCLLAYIWWRIVKPI